MKNPKYAAVKALIEAKKIKNLNQMFEIVNMSIVAKDMGVHYTTLYTRIHNPRLLTVENLAKMAELIEVPAAEILNIALATYSPRK
ncbi:hypothetical protein [Chitinophaga sancti]|uniref:Cro/C1-type HTH DNA-binding domain-containing protein n=1 Tax=Chitinophaga sancti TaxID=1004 RepID=A0A1K1MGS9_9BACT|nr:hypothetical protein [Chitinophaga sancti]WQD62672.1 hypothetical protein U0033_32780 [Chitinophaga sancti]WQG91704.1 hypothetical protein SR876_09325 [Chitinophaga sancti]SFW22315.1 hypothetical protein SAMN05661012_00561 [Chitinophaga sancti]